MFAGTTCPATPNCRYGTGRNQAPRMALNVKGSDPVVDAIMSRLLYTGFAVIANGVLSIISE